MTKRGRPPFRADHVGSLLRPRHLLEARKQCEAKRISPAELRCIEDEEIRRLVRLQEEIGLECVTDGELRRGSWHMDFLCQIGGVEVAGAQRRPFRNDEGDVENELPVPKVVERLHLERPIFGDDFAFLKSVAKAVPKLSIPSPSMLDGLGAIAETGGVYRDRDEFLADLVRVYAEQVRLLGHAGCTYLQIDDTMFAMLADPGYRNKIRATTGDPGQRHMTYIRLVNEALAHRPSTMTVCVHTCRGNHRSAWAASGGYDPVAEAVFNGLEVDGLFLEYDDARAGSFEPLRHVPKDKMIVLGLVTSKKGRLESKDELKRRIEEAARFVDLDQLCLSPQCGFASTLEGNLLTEAEQLAKLRLVVETARDVWGTA
jgi:5-methyltetrahydropteroyltriglutamate--homocysteine methyltransferase